LLPTSSGKAGTVERQPAQEETANKGSHTEETANKRLKVDS
jgi:hypothetical protein